MIINYDNLSISFLVSFEKHLMLNFVSAEDKVSNQVELNIIFCSIDCKYLRPVSNLELRKIEHSALLYDVTLVSLVLDNYSKTVLIKSRTGKL